jgi:hypothetical protein
VISSCACSFQYEGVLIGASGGCEDVFVCPWHDSPILRGSTCKQASIGSEQRRLPTSLQNCTKEATTWPDSTCMGMSDKVASVHALQSDKRSHVAGCRSNWDGRTGRGTAPCKCFPAAPHFKIFFLCSCTDRPTVRHRSSLTTESMPTQRLP